MEGTHYEIIIMTSHIRRSKMNVYIPKPKLKCFYLTGFVLQLLDEKNRHTLLVENVVIQCDNKNTKVICDNTLRDGTK